MKNKMNCIACGKEMINPLSPQCGACQDKGREKARQAKAKKRAKQAGKQTKRAWGEYAWIAGMNRQL